MMKRRVSSCGRLAQLPHYYDWSKTSPEASPAERLISQQLLDHCMADADEFQVSKTVTEDPGWGIPADANALEWAQAASSHPHVLRLLNLHDHEGFPVEDLAVAYDRLLFEVRMGRPEVASRVSLPFAPWDEQHPQPNPGSKFPLTEQSVLLLRAV
jgi:hypothetical protein